VIILNNDEKRHTIGIFRWYQFLARCVQMVALERFELEFRSRFRWRTRASFLLKLPY